MHIFWCRLSLEKTLNSAQNLESKGPEYFCPRRSMVLKVVTGKILRTLELSCWVQSRSIRDAAACGSILGRRDEVEAAATVGWSEIIDYLLVDVIAVMLSHVTNQVKEKVEDKPGGSPRIFLPYFSVFLSRPYPGCIDTYPARPSAASGWKCWGPAATGFGKSVVSCQFSVLSLLLRTRHSNSAVRASAG